MGAANDDGMSNVTADEVDENMLPMTQRMGLSHVVGDEVAGDGYPMRAVVAFALPVISNMRTMVTVMSNGAAVCINNTGTHQTCQARMRLSKFVQLFPIGNMVMVRKWQVAGADVMHVIVVDLPIWFDSYLKSTLI